MTTGSLVDGLNKGPMMSGAAIVTMPTITYIQGSPDNVLTVQVGSDLAIDVITGAFYMGEIVAGSQWIHLVSGT